jgi:hypothetical protein
MTFVYALALGAALFAAGCPAHGDPTVPGPTDPPVDTPDPIDPGGSGTDDAAALTACLDNFQQLNPTTPVAELQQTFCTGAEALAPFRTSTAKRAH